MRRLIRELHPILAALVIIGCQPADEGSTDASAGDSAADRIEGPFDLRYAYPELASVSGLPIFDETLFLADELLVFSETAEMLVEHPAYPFSLPDEAVEEVLAAGRLDPFAEMALLEAAEMYPAGIRYEAPVGGSFALSLPAGLLEGPLELSAVSVETGHAATWYGSVRGTPGSSAVIVVDEEGMAGSVQVADTILSLFQVPDRTLVIRRHSQRPMGEELPPLHPPENPPGEGPPQPRADAAPGCPGEKLNVLVVYTDQAVRLLGPFRPEHAARLAVGQANFALQAAGLPQRFDLLGPMRVNYREEGDPNIDLGRLQRPSDTFMDSVHEWRDRLDADLVSLWVGDSARGAQPVCGRAYLFTSNYSSFVDYGFSLVRADCAYLNYSFAHELGHNLGLEHDRRSAQGSQGADPFSYGYHDTLEEFRTIMAYDCPNRPGCPPHGRVLYYSSPGTTHPQTGRPLGISHGQDPTNSADNTRTLAWTLCNAATWRP